MNMKLLAFCVGCSLVFTTTSMADNEPEEAPAILAALGQQAGVAVVSAAELAEIEGTGWLPRQFRRALRRSIRHFFRINRAQRLRIIRARIAWLRARRSGGGGEVPVGGGEVPVGGGEVPVGGGGTEPPEMAE